MYEIAEIRKYPRTPHLEDSRLQPGDEDLDRVPTGALAGANVVVEEKLDGANVGISVTVELAVTEAAILVRGT